MSDDLEARVARFITERADGSPDDARRDALLVELLRDQASHVEPYGRLVRARKCDRDRATRPDDFPALPTDVFRFARVARHASSDDVKVFFTSGTTQETRGGHAFADLALYDLAARTAAKHALFPDVAYAHLVLLAPPAARAPSSSLSYMFGRFGEWFGGGAAHVAWLDEAIDLQVLEHVANEAAHDAHPVAILGTSFAFVHLLDALAGRTIALSRGSRAMQTGGFKGRARAVDKGVLIEQIASAFAIAPSSVVTEYGMTELSSQMYDTCLRDACFGAIGADSNKLWVPPWVRVSAVDPETLEPRTAGERGILRIDDLANVGSVAAIQTSDVGFVIGNRVELFGPRTRSNTAWLLDRGG